MTRDSRSVYAEMYGPTVGDRVRLGDTGLLIEVERDDTRYGEEVKFGGGKVIRDGMGQSQMTNRQGAVDTVITNALILDHWGIVKADVGLKDGRISAIGKAGNPDIQPGVTIIIGPGTEIIAGEGKILTAGGFDAHIHFICPQQVDEALMQRGARQAHLLAQLVDGPRRGRLRMQQRQGSADVSIARLFVAGVLPGIMLMLLFSGYIIAWALLDPRRTPARDSVTTFGQKLYAARYLLPAVGLIGVVIGSIYAGVATPTEAAVIGVAGSLALAAVTGSLSWKNFADSVMGATKTSCMIAFILAGAAFLTVAMGFTGVPRIIAEWIAAQGFTAAHLIAVLTLLFIVLGCFIDGISMVVLTSSVVLPSVAPGARQHSSSPHA